MNIFALNFDSVRVAIPSYLFATGRVQGQPVPDSARDVLTRRNFPSLDLEPIAVLLIVDLVVQVKKRTDSVHSHKFNTSPDDIYFILAAPHPLRL